VDISTLPLASSKSVSKVFPTTFSDLVAPGLCEFVESEKNFSSAIEFISELKIQREELEKMVERGREGLIMAKLEQGREKMQTADQLFEDVRYYDSKEGYKTSREYLEGVLEEASGYKLSELVDELTSLIQACSQNISAATAALMDVNVGAVEPKMQTADNGLQFGSKLALTIKATYLQLMLHMVLYWGFTIQTVAIFLSGIIISLS